MLSERCSNDGYLQCVSTSINVCVLLVGSGRFILIPLASSQQNLYNMYLLLRVQCYTTDDGQSYCPKHVESYSKNKFDISVLLVGFIIRTYHDARSSECQNFKT